jgi:hypothetical protein
LLEGDQRHLFLTKECEDVDAFTQWLDRIPVGSLPKLSMPVSLSLLTQPGFLNLITTLNRKSPDVLVLDVGDAWDTHAEDIEHELITKIIPLVDFPIQLKNKKSMAFEQAMIQRLQAAPQSPKMASAQTATEEVLPLVDHGKKIRLKTLIGKDADDQSKEHLSFVAIDTQHVEEVDQNAEQIVEENLDVEETVELEQMVEHETPYEGALVDFAAFSSGRYREIAKNHFGEAALDAAYELIRHEFFANVPHGIKYLSPAAAERLAEHLPEWAAMNKDQCGPFVVKKTPKQELVLDDEYDELDEKKPFALHEFSPYEDREPYYDVTITPPDAEVAALLCRDLSQMKKLSNLWIRHGDTGILEFYKHVRSLDSTHVGLSQFLVDHYLNHFSHWAPFYHESFFDALRKLENYTPLQINCLKRFLAKTGSSQHNLSQTLEAFDAFWYQFNALCKGDEALLSQLDCDWSTPIGGQPAVYMQRLLTILKNAKHLPDQLVSLNGIVLSQYGAYYASRYEGFTEVHPAMGFTYRPDSSLNTEPFHPQRNLYRVEIETLEREATNAKAWKRWNSMSGEECSEPMSTEEFSHLMYRYMGQQLAGMTVLSFHQQLTSTKEWPENRVRYNLTAFRPSGRSPIFPHYLLTRRPNLGSIRLRFLKTLLLVTSDRYKGSLDKPFSSYDVVNEVGLAYWEEVRLKHGHEHYGIYIHRQENNTFQELMRFSDPGHHASMEQIAETLTRLKQLKQHHIHLSDDEAFIYQYLQRESYEAFENDRYGLSVSESYRIKLEKDEQQKDFQDRLHHLLRHKKSSALNLLHFLGRCLTTGERGPKFLYALNTEAYFSSVTEIAQTYHEELLTLSAQLLNPKCNIALSDFNKALKTTSERFNSLKNIRNYLYESTQGNPLQNRFYYTFQRLIDSHLHFTYEHVLNILDEVDRLKLTPGQVDTAAVHVILEKHGIPVCFKRLQVPHHKSDGSIKNELREILVILEVGLPPLSMDKTVEEQYEKNTRPLLNELQPLDIPALQDRFRRVLPKANIAIQALIGLMLKPLVRKMLDKKIRTYFKTSLDLSPKLTEYWIASMASLKEFQALDDFVGLDRITSAIRPMSILFSGIIKHPCVLSHQDEMMALFSKLDFTQMDSELIHHWFDFLSSMPERDYMPLLRGMLSEPNPTILYQKTAFKELIHSLKRLHTHHVSTEAMVGFYQRFVTAPATSEKQYDAFIVQIVRHFNKNPDDPIVSLCLKAPGFSLAQAVSISRDTDSLTIYRSQLTELYQRLLCCGQLDGFLALSIDPEQKPMILNILAMAHSGRRPNDKEVDLLLVAKQLKDLSSAHLLQLNAHYNVSITSIACLTNALNQLKPEDSFDTFIATLEREPFGARDFEAQFSQKEVERVVNGSLDLQHHNPYPYSRRRQWMEAFLLVNDLGQTLPVYHGKPAKDLSNAELRACFSELKGNVGQYSATQRKICALAIMREAMYRATGQFPYSTQMLGVIDCMLHEGDVISNIDTGQGKSLIDVMKAAFLYLESERVDISTSSLVDAARDIDNYSPFLSLLGVPFSKRPIQANTPPEELCLDGIQFSTFSQLALRRSKALAAGEVIDPPNQRVSLVLNESDYALLDDRAIKRLASPPERDFTKKHPWIYDEINAFVQRPDFMRNDTSADEDVRRLRRHLVDVIKTKFQKQGALQGRLIALIHQMEKESLVTWLESAIIVNHRLKEDTDYVVLPVPGKAGESFARILMSDGRPSTDSVFGKGIQQLLHARLNQKSRSKAMKDDTAEVFEITPENRTIISTDNRTLVNDYRAQHGFIWGSSGTVGSDQEMDEQIRKFGFEFSKLEPHQEKQTKERKIVLSKNNEAHYARLSNELKKKRRRNTVPLIIFCENIDKAREMYDRMVKTLGGENLQLNLGTHAADAEKAFIKRAATPNMCTITTAAIGRNTDIPYDKKQGLDIWFTSISSTRLDRQKLGRTGRQGSPGTISYFLNKEDQDIRSKKDILALREALDAEGKKEREQHESLYRIIGFFLAKLKSIPSCDFTLMSKHDFIYRRWSTYSDELEQRYRQQVLEKRFEEPAFFNTAKEEFLALLKEAVPDAQLGDCLLENAFDPTTSTTLPNMKPVRMEECTPAIDIAYQLFHQDLRRDSTQKSGLTEDQKKALLTELRALFSSHGRRQPMNHTQFFNAVLSSPASCKELRGNYQDFLRDYLCSRKTSWFFMRWLGLDTPLNHIADDRHYLVLFRGLASVDSTQPLPEAKDLKTMAVNMIEEYLQNAWWIGRDKREAAIQLQNDIRSSLNIDEVITKISKGQIAIATKDITANKNRFGNSRLQNTLSRILTMAASLGIETHSDDLVSKLLPMFRQLTGADLGEKPDLNVMTAQINRTSGNARVLARSLSCALQLKDDKTPTLPGMTGRKGPSTS